MTKLSELRELLAKATAGRWQVSGDEYSTFVQTEICGTILFQSAIRDDMKDEHNAFLVAVLKDKADLLLDLWEACDGMYVQSKDPDDFGMPRTLIDWGKAQDMRRVLKKLNSGE